MVVRRFAALCASMLTLSVFGATVEGAPANSVHAASAASVVPTKAPAVPASASQVAERAGHAGVDDVSSRCELQAPHLELRDYAAVIGLFLTAGFFLWRLRVDTVAIRYRETIALLEKWDEKLSENWAKVQGSEWIDEDSFGRWSGMVDSVALLVQKKVLDDELIYNHWWEMFDETDRCSMLTKHIEQERQHDQHVLKHYARLCKKWKARIAREGGKRLAAPVARCPAVEDGGSAAAVTQAVSPGARPASAARLA